MAWNFGGAARKTEHIELEESTVRWRRWRLENGETVAAEALRLELTRAGSRLGNDDVGGDGAGEIAASFNDVVVVVHGQRNTARKLLDGFVTVAAW
ncbi:hypothetical protein M0R45_005053 [Rubus argutus]|uniref:Uncharacterized protein n=1 Tax=Rubus argutus TaxID=59490 RepID=A0AAW1YLH8_RUBAR